jgi:hypothetical protein
METLINEMVPFFKDAWVTAGWLGVLGGVLMFAIRIFRLGPVQDRLPPKARWDAWPTWLKWLSPFIGALAGMAIIQIAGGIAWAPAIAAAITAAVLSIGGNAGTKKLGEIEAKRQLAKDPNYVASFPRRIAGPIVPVPGYIKRHGMPEGYPDTSKPPTGPPEQSPR